MRNKKTVNWFIILPIAWMAVIFLFSHQPGSESAELSGTITEVVVRIISVLGIQVEENAVHDLIRSLAHFSIFFVLGLLWYFNFWLKGMKAHKAAILSAIIGIIYAAADEIHQLFIPGRACDIKDVLVDTAGVLLAVFLSCGIGTRNRRTGF